MRPELHEVPERRSRPESAEQLSLRAEHVVHAYLAAHPDYTLREEVEAGRLPIEKAYRIMKESARDPKTGVQRSDLLKYALEYEMYQTRETGEPVTVAVFDIDDFKRINTELTHVGADGVLKRVADIITEE
ncbi:MAG: diguanylate cyclase, partial [Candidatus Kerfeldbacteria bacterium]|nr:diguanylate cyclase [Candidatus Kerfeldbacteria bacterium]